MKVKEEVKKEEIDLEAETLTDLPVAQKQDDETKGGQSKSSPKLGLYCANGQHI